jgi:serine/threonine protein kinase
MTLAPLSRVGPYEIVSALGAGGMGQVYLAEDTRLGRKVAIKTLAASGTPDSERRFEREARAASALNHPNIVTIYEIGEAAFGRFIMMEFVDGRTLRSLLAQGAALDRLPSLGRQMGKALAAAHERGIGHRDIKPENVIVREDGHLKILDFGLAQLLAAPSDVTETRLSLPGALLGTVKYMAPEQARGQPTTSATDIFALGLIFYELATGRHPFVTDKSMFGIYVGDRNPARAEAFGA